MSNFIRITDVVRTKRTKVFGIPNNNYKIKFGDTTSTYTKNNMIILYLLLQLPLEYKCVIDERYDILSGDTIYSSKLLNKVVKLVFKELIVREEKLEYIGEFKLSIFKMIEYFSNNFYKRIQKYSLSISFTDLMEIADNEKVVDIRSRVPAVASSDGVLKLYDEFNEVMISTKKPNNMEIMYLSGVVKARQVHQLFVMKGIGTTPRNHIIATPVRFCYYSGITNLFDLISEKTASLIALQLSHVGISFSENYKRLLTHVGNKLIGTQYEDCGSEMADKWFIDTDRELKMFDGTYYRTEDGKLKVIEYEDDKHLIGTTINARTALHCQANPYVKCRICLGRTYFSIPRHASPGLVYITNNTQKASQTMFSYKHIIGSSVSQALYLDKTQVKYMILANEKTGYGFKGLKAVKREIIISSEELKGLHNLTAKDIGKTDGDRISSIKAVKLRFTDKRGNVKTEYIRIERFGVIGRLSQEFIDFAIKVGSTIENGSYVIDTSEWTGRDAFVLFKQVATSPLEVVKKNFGFLTSKKSAGMTYWLMLSKYAEMQNSNGGFASISELSVVVSLFLQSEDGGQYEGVGKSKIGSIRDVVSNLSLGGQYGFKEITKYLSHPASFVPDGKSQHPGDVNIMNRSEEELKKMFRGYRKY